MDTTSTSQNTPLVAPNGGAPLTPEQIKSYLATTPTAPTLDHANPDVSWAAFDAAMKPAPASSTDSVASYNQGQSGGEASNAIKDTVVDYGSKLIDTYAQTPSKIADDVTQGANDIQHGMESGNIGDVFKGVAKSGLRTTGDVANAIYAPISTAVGMVFDKLGINDAIAHSELVDKLSNQKWLQDFALNHPNAGEDFGRALTLAMSGQEKGTIDPKAVVSEIKGYVNGATKGVASGVGTAVSEVKNAPSALKNTATDMAVNSEKAGWTKPTETPTRGYIKPTEIYNNAKSQGHDIGDTIVNNGIKLSDHIEPNQSGTGKVFNTSDTADMLRQDAAKTSNEMLRPALVKADAVVPKTPVSDIINSAKDRINENKSLTQETKDSINEKLDSTQTSLEKANPDGFKLSEMHDEKITRDINSKYNPLGDIASNMEATKNKALADALRAEVEGKAPKEIPVKEFNSELQKQYQAADYLDSLHGKTVPKGVMSRVANFVAKVVGAKAGSVVGGGIFGGVAGYHIGGMIESMIENMPNPIRNSLLNNLEKSNPEAFNKVSDYLNNRATNGSVAKPISTASIKTDMSNSIPQLNDKGQQMGTYKLGKNQSTGRIEPTGEFRKPNQNFFPNESKLKISQRKFNLTKKNK